MWIAERRGRRGHVAVKILSVVMDSEEERRDFARAASALVRARNRHLLATIDHGFTPGSSPYVVMAMPERQNLSKRIVAKGPLSPRAAVQLVQQLCGGLQRLHAEGITHGAVTARQVQLCAAGAKLNGPASLLRYEQNQRRSAARLRTPAYESPELLYGGERNHLSDLWSAAVVAYEALTAATPFFGTSLADTCQKIERGRHKPPSQRRPDLALEVDAFFRHAFRTDPSQRFQSAAAMSNAFVRAIDPAAADYHPAFDAIFSDPAPPSSGRHAIRPPPNIGLTESGIVPRSCAPDTVPAPRTTLRAGSGSNAGLGRFTAALKSLFGSGEPPAAASNG